MSRFVLCGILSLILTLLGACGDGGGSSVTGPGVNVNCVTSNTGGGTGTIGPTTVNVDCPTNSGNVVNNPDRPVVE